MESFVDVVKEHFWSNKNVRNVNKELFLMDRNVQKLKYQIAWILINFGMEENAFVYKDILIWAINVLNVLFILTGMGFVAKFKKDTM